MPIFWALTGQQSQGWTMTNLLPVMPRYEAYKDSGVEWIGVIPDHWEKSSCKRLLSIPITDGPHTTSRFLYSGIPFISAESIKNGVINFESMRGYISEQDYALFSLKYRPKVNDIYMVKSGATTGRVAMVKTDKKFTIWSPLAVFRADLSKVQPYFLYFFLMSNSFQKGIELNWSYGTQQNIGMKILGNLKVACPSNEEQIFITNFLNCKIAKIDQAVAIKEKQIQLLKERKQILIQNAVTKGLDPNVLMADSGVEWIGEIPAHWQVKRLKYILDERKERSKMGTEPLFMVSQIHGLVVRSEYHQKEQVAQSNIDNKIVYENDLVFNKLKAHLGVFFKSSITFKGLVSPDYAVYKSKGIISDLKYLELLFRHPAYIGQFIIRATGIVEGLIRLYTGDLFEIPVPVPPETEQINILSHIQTQSAKIDQAIPIQEQMIEKLKEYKATLINAAVTGKIKVADPAENKVVV